MTRDIQAYVWRLASIKALVLPASTSRISHLHSTTMKFTILFALALLGVVYANPTPDVEDLELRGDRQSPKHPHFPPHHKPTHHKPPHHKPPHHKPPHRKPPHKPPHHKPPHHKPPHKKPHHGGDGRRD
ncbi:hypothetical protein BDZ94DRAFT_191741 [Collybia nuda]|uniref:Uncharacterized protein n=1 Tax=Collybia nuda TaxID=64659 RepID=A0A9P6C9V1_9AGAR|nr:hypothetical protein BDZ94DRAFT_191741 [Collybia nuda]